MGIVSVVKSDRVAARALFDMVNWMLEIGEVCG